MGRIKFVKIDQMAPEAGYNVWLDGKIVASIEACEALDNAYEIDCQERGAADAYLETKWTKHERG